MIRTFLLVIQLDIVERRQKCGWYVWREEKRTKDEISTREHKMSHWFSTKGKEENTSSSTSTTKTSASNNEKDTLLMSWNVAAGATVILPLLVFMIARFVSSNRDGGGDGEGGGEEEEEEEGGGWWTKWWGGNDDDGGEEGRGWWWWWGNGDARPEDQGKGALAFVYVWALVVFAVLVWRGNRVLGNKKDTRALFAALVVFANFTFLCWILVAGLGVSMMSLLSLDEKILFLHSYCCIQVQREGEAAEQGWLGQFPATMVLTFVFWTIFGIIFASILYGKIHKNKSRGRNDDYLKYEDEGGII